MTIEAIPTAYMGTEYRSRLEARWALFFNLCDFRWKYEPRGYGTAPDFEVEGITVEVKGKMPNVKYQQYLRHLQVDYLAIGGFFEYRSPQLIQIQPEGILGVDFYSVFPYRILFNRACEYRFDL